MVVCVWMGPAPASAADRPAYNQSRYMEDYGFLKDPARRTDYMDPLKFIPLNSAAVAYLSLGGETRQHFEYINNENWGAGPQDNNGWYLQRYLLHGDLHLGDRFRLFGQLMSGILIGRNGGPRGVDVEDLGVNQLFADYRFGDSEQGALTVRLGRQEIIFGSRRFFNYRERPNMRLSHDAFKFIYEKGAWNITGFAARPVRLNPDVFDNSSTNAHAFWGLYGVRSTGLIFPANIDLYYIGLNQEQARYDQGTADDVRQTVGARAWGKYRRLDYNFEFVYQLGTFGAGNIRAWAFASDTGYTLMLGGERKLRLSVRADIYSGDDNPADPDLNSFNPFFPKGKHISQLAPVGIINSRQVQPKINFTLDRHWSAVISGMFVWRDSRTDGVYSIGNGLLRTGQLSQARYVGYQQEVEIKWAFDRHLDIKAIFNWFDAGRFLKETPPGDNITYLGGMLTYRF